MNKEIAFLLSLSILVPALVSIFRVGQIDKIYYPFLYALWFGSLNEILSIWLADHNYSIAINNNLYVLGESILLICLFRNLASPAKRKLHVALIIIMIAIWLYENLYLNKIYGISSYFRISYSFFIVLLSITAINKLISSVTKNLFQNPVFLLCAGFLIYFTLKILIEVFWLYGINAGKQFQAIIYIIMVYTNLFTNLIYALAILWMPHKQPFTMPS